METRKQLTFAVKEKIMKHLKVCLSLLTTFILLTSCVSAPDLKKVKMSSNVTSKILNLRNSGTGNTSTVIADSVMKNGFLSTGEEYGYYTLNITSSTSSRSNADDYSYVVSIIGPITLGTMFLLGAPTDVVGYNLALKMDILDSNKNIVRSYSDSTKITKAAGIYYGADATPKASRAFTRMIRNVQRIAAAESDLINEELLAVGPIRRQVAQRPKDITGAVENAAKVIIGSLKQRNLTGQRIAIVNISSQDREQTEFIAAELEFLLVSNSFIVVDRNELDRIRKEQNFQLSGDVDDAQIVSIGKFAGAGIVITGSITGSGSTRRLRLRALDTQTAEVRAVASEQF